MKQLVTIILIIFSTTLFSQIGKVPVVEYYGVKCYEHIVKKKQTAYGISRLYHVNINKLYEINPEAQSGLTVGQKIYLPLPDSEQSTTTVKPKGESIQQEGVPANETQIIHTVQKGETLWSISRKYGVKAKDVTNANIEKGNNLNIGDKIKIPISDAVKKDETTPIVDIPVNPIENPEDSIILHKVLRGETMYGIASKYGVTQQAILTANNNLTKGLKKGMKIRIPLKRKVILKPEIKEEIALVDTNKVDSLTNIVVTNSRLEEVYDVAILLPFEITENARRMRKCPAFGECLTYSKTFRALNFHHGMMMAIDSLQKAGLNLNIRVYDTKSDTAIINGILKSVAFKGIDLILGPIYVKEIKVVSKFAKQHKIQMICPVPVSNKALFKNPYVSKLTASKYTQVEYLANYIAENYNTENIILVRNKYNKVDEIYFQLFKKTYAKSVLQYATRTSDSVKVAIGVGKSSRLIYVQQHMVDGKKNIIVDLSTNLGHISNLVTKLTTTMNSNPYNRYEIALFGMEDWQTFETIDEKYKSRYNLSIVAPGFLDFNSAESIKFIKKYRAKYGTDPDKFAFIGFDAAFTNLKGLLLYGTEYSKHYHQIITKGYYTTSDYQSAEQGSGFENKNISIINYDNYHLKKVN